MSNLITHNPAAGALIVDSEPYREHMARFKRSVDALGTLVSNGAIEPDVNITDANTVRAIEVFVRWASGYSREQWQKGVRLSQASMAAVCGRSNDSSPLSQARRACLVKVDAGYPKGGVPASYSLSIPHLLGMAAALTANAAHQTRASMVEMEVAEHRMREMAKLEEVLVAKGLTLDVPVIDADEGRPMLLVNLNNAV